jgi:phosphoglucosamine mutase
LLNVRVSPGFDWQKIGTGSGKIKVEAELAGRGRVLIRASGTEPVIRVMVEADDNELASTCARRLIACVDKI